jgi:hypothetical protein
MKISSGIERFFFDLRTSAYVTFAISSTSSLTYDANSGLNVCTLNR